MEGDGARKTIELFDQVKASVTESGKEARGVVEVFVLAPADSPASAQRLQQASIAAAGFLLGYPFAYDLSERTFDGEYAVSVDIRRLDMNRSADDLAIASTDGLDGFEPTPNSLDGLDLHLFRTTLQAGGEQVELSAFSVPACCVGTDAGFAADTSEGIDASVRLRIEQAKEKLQAASTADASFECQDLRAWLAEAKVHTTASMVNMARVAL